MNMSNFKDLFTNYAVFLGRRFYPKDKLKFLALAQKEFEEAGYPVNITQADEKVLGDTIYYRNLYAGDFSKAKVVLVSYYDTPRMNIVSEQPIAFDSAASKFSGLNMLLLPVITMMLTLLIFYILLMPGLSINGFLSMSGLLTTLLFIAALMITRKYRFGIPKRNNIVRNSSSIVVMLLYASRKKLNKTRNKDVAFAMIDSGTTNNYGEVMLEDYLKDRKLKVIMLDSVGGNGEPHVFTNRKVKLNQLGVRQHIKSSYLAPVGDVFLTSGELGVDDQILVQEKDDSDIKEIEIRYLKVVELIDQIVESLKK